MLILKNEKMEKIKYFIIAISVILAFSCESILEPPIKGQVALEDLLSTEDGIITAVNGTYQPLQSLYQGNILVLTEKANDDGWCWRKEIEPDFFIITSTYSEVQSIWTLLYRGITRANSVIDNIQEVDFSNETLKKACEGQAKFLRAYYYFNLVRLFGEAPLIVNEIIYREDAEQPRASIEAIYTQIKKDLDEAATLLPASYSGGSGMETGRATSNTAIALKSAVSLELEEWSEVVQLTDQIKNHGSLLPDYANNFNGTQENGPGSLFEVQYGGVTGSTTTNISSNLAPPDFNGAANITPTDDNLNGEGGGLTSGNGFVQLFEEGDLRKDVIISGYDIPNFIFPSEPDGSLYYVNKYYNTKDPRGLSTWNYPLIRVAEVYLNRAEALNEIGYQANGEAFEYLNKTRVNAGLTALTSVDLPDQNAFRTALRKERRIELSFECKRYFDLNRWGILNEVIQYQMDITGGLTFPTNKMINHPITGKKYFLYPIPAIEYANNANLTDQNPGY
jgi:starch-binding outer membrane protein, SusD/RagB family